MFLKHVFSGVCLFFFSTNIVAKSSTQKIDDVISGIYQAVAVVTTMYELGDLTDMPYEHQVSKNVTLIFARSSYDHDLDLAFSLLNKLEKKREQILQTPNPNLVKSEKPKRELTRMEKLMKAEKQMQKHMPEPQIMITDYDVMSAFKETRENRLNIKNKAAEADMQMVVAERQAAELEMTQRKQRQQALQQQAAAWQEEMDNQAVERANAMREWKKQNSFGSHVRRIFTGVLQAGIGSFTGSLTGSISTNLANNAIEKIFGDDYPKEPVVKSYQYQK